MNLTIAWQSTQSATVSFGLPVPKDLDIDSLDFTKRSRRPPQTRLLTTTGYIGELKESRPAHSAHAPQPHVEYSLDWLEDGNDSPRQVKAMCSSPNRRLKKLEADIGRLSRKPASSPVDRAQPKETKEAVSILEQRRRRDLEDYDWSLPDLDIPDDFYRKENKRNPKPKPSNHDDSALGAAACAVTSQQGQDNTVILKDELELSAWKAKKLGDDYKFTRLSSDDDLELFINQHTLPDEDDYVQPIPEILYNENTRRFQLESPQRLQDKKGGAKTYNNNGNPKKIPKK